MASDWLNHKQLMIIKGVGKTPGDTASAEPDPVIANLMDGVTTLDNWSPNVPAVKSGGVWADSPINDGRTLLAAPTGNVTESMTITISDASYNGAFGALSNLNKMVSDCRDFWQTETQVDPVYLAWWAGCGVGLQYALLYNIEIKPEYIASPNPTIRVTMTLEREPAWRMGVPPGANPKIWTYYVNTSHAPFNVNTASILTANDSLAVQAVSNRREWNTTQTGILSQNFIDIPASSIPGDAPALACIYIRNTLSVGSWVMLSRWSKPVIVVNQSGVSVPMFNMLNAGDAEMKTDAVVTADATAPASNSSASGQRVTVSFGTDATMKQRIVWDSVAASETKPDFNQFRGTYAVFIRAKMSAAGSTINVQFGYFVDGASTGAIATSASAQVTQSTDWQLIYLGTVTFPLNAKAISSMAGNGLQMSSQIVNTSNLSINVLAERTAGGASLHLSDLIMMPIDEQAILSSDQNADKIFDGTGYSNHGGGTW